MFRKSLTSFLKPPNSRIYSLIVTSEGLNSLYKTHFLKLTRQRESLRLMVSSCRLLIKFSEVKMQAPFFKGVKGSFIETRTSTKIFKLMTAASILNARTGSSCTT